MKLSKSQESPPLEWLEWAQHPQTELLLRKLKESKQETMEAWASEAYVGQSAELTYGANAKALGGIDLLDKVINLIEEGW